MVHRRCVADMQIRISDMRTANDENNENDGTGQNGVWTTLRHKTLLKHQVQEYTTGISRVVELTLPSPAATTKYTWNFASHASRAHSHD